MGKELKDPQLINRKRAEKIVDTLISLMHDEDPGYGADFKMRLVDEVGRIMNPQIEEVHQDFESSQIAAFGYDPVSSVLQVDFHTGSRYWYHGVEKDIVTQLTEAESKGKFFAARVKPNYPYEQIA